MRFLLPHEENIPIGYEIDNDFEGKYVIGNTSNVGHFSGNDYHVHQVISFVVQPTASGFRSVRPGGGAYPASAGHNHNGISNNYEMKVGKNLPPYYSIKFLKRKVINPSLNLNFNGYVIFCYKISNTSLEVCSGNGVCSNLDSCKCHENYYGDTCNLTSCFGINSNEYKVCSYHGNCLKYDVCTCDKKYIFGKDCSVSFLIAVVEYWYIIPAALIALIILFVVLILVVVICCKKKKKNKNYKQLDIVQQEAELSKNSFAKLKINKSLFMIPYTEIKLLKICGEGGSDSGKKKIIAFKVFQILTLTSQEYYDEFESELSVVSGLNHPNIARFMGASLNPPRVGIVFEYYNGGNLEEYILQNSKTRKTIPTKEKIRISLEIAQGAEFLHSRNIIHRDLKCANILLDDKKTVKISDFGLSKVFDEKKRNQTRRIGTAAYMSPQMILNKKYTLATDVYSFGIILYELFSMNTRLYGDRMNYELEVSKNNLRPIFKEKQQPKWIEKLATRCWQFEESDRPSFEEVIEILNRPK